ncbi:hypothetical protein D3C72_2040010 [compost metagenome]
MPGGIKNVEEFRHGEHRVMSIGEGNRPGMTRLAITGDFSVTKITAYTRHDPGRQIALYQNRTLLDVDLEIGAHTFRVDNRSAGADRLHVDACGFHMVGKRPSVTSMSCGKFLR